MLTVKDLLKTQLVLANKLTLFHWFESKSLSQHELTESAYVVIRDGVDRIAEYISTIGKDDENFMLTEQYVKDIFNAELSPLKMIEESIKINKEIRGKFSTETALQSLIDDTNADLSSIYYKLNTENKNIKAKVKAKKHKDVKTKKISANVQIEKYINNILTKLKLHNSTTLVYEKSTGLFTLTYEGNNPQSVTNKLLRELSGLDRFNYEAYLEDIDNDIAVILCDRLS